jgi:hypothetical protein
MRSSEVITCSLRFSPSGLCPASALKKEHFRYVKFFVVHSASASSQKKKPKEGLFRCATKTLELLQTEFHVSVSCSG